jgi:sulfite reductase (NADPH) flavoprotein alpha-component
MSKTLPPPIPALLPESAPFTAEQRAWLNGFFAGYLGLDNGGVTALSPARRRRRRRGAVARPDHGAARPHEAR